MVITALAHRKKTVRPDSPIQQGTGAEASDSGNLGGGVIGLAAAVWRLATGRRKPKPKTRHAIASVLGVTAADLF